VNNLLNVSDLKKSYGKVEAVKGIDFYVEKGSFFAFLGPNGAGKSTTIEMLCTLMKPDSGMIELDGLLVGRDDEKIRRSIGVVFQRSLLDPLLTVKENLFLRGGFYGLSGNRLKSAVERAADATGVAEFLNRPYGRLSGGQRRRADIARALIHTPKILFLDEPSTGLDPQSRKMIWETVRMIQKESGMAVFLTTHYMEEAENADYITVIDHGRISAKGTPLELKNDYSSDCLKISTGELEQVEELLNSDNIAYSLEQDGIKIPVRHTTEAIPILKLCEGLIKNFEVRNGTMDDVFINITGEAVRE
jgi:multidrug/hemolysin transport system ATP-binding protein